MKARKPLINIEDQERNQEQSKRQKDFQSYLLKKGYSNTTTAGYQNETDRFLKWVKKENLVETELSYTDILVYIGKVKKGIKKSSTAKKVNSIRHYYNYLEATEQVVENPSTQIQIKNTKNKILHEILTKKELENLYHNYPINQTKEVNKVLASKRNKIIIGLLIWQGVTAEEIGKITLEDIKLRESKIEIKGGRRSNVRILKLEAEQILDLMEYQLTTRQEILKYTQKETNKLFTSIGSSDRIINSLTKLIKSLQKQNSKLKSLNQIRASVITYWLKIHNLRETQYRAGHRYVSSTESYKINDLEDLQEAINKYHPLA